MSEMKKKVVAADVSVLFGFNTGRMYGPNGQQITVAIMKDHDVLFNDHTRMIFGKLKAGNVLLKEITPSVALRLYDRNEYEFDMSNRASWIKAASFPRL